jgi:hypothetical protein
MLGSSYGLSGDNSRDERILDDFATAASGLNFGSSSSSKSSGFTVERDS